MPEITRCPPGAAKGSTLYSWQFGAGPAGLLDVGTARRLADGDLKPCEIAVLDIVLAESGDIPQRVIEGILADRMGATRSMVYAAAQRLAKHGKICRKKIGKRWHYAKPGFHWLRPLGRSLSAK